MGSVRSLGSNASRRGSAVIYARVSTKTNQDKGGVDRQVRASKNVAMGRGERVARTVAEVISGSLPLAARTTFKELLADTNVRTVYRLRRT